MGRPEGFRGKEFESLEFLGLGFRVQGVLGSRMYVPGCCSFAWFRLRGSEIEGLGSVCRISAFC